MHQPHSDKNVPVHKDKRQRQEDRDVTQVQKKVSEFVTDINQDDAKTPAFFQKILTEKSWLQSSIVIFSKMITKREMKYCFILFLFLDKGDGNSLTSY